MKKLDSFPSHFPPQTRFSIDNTNKEQENTNKQNKQKQKKQIKQIKTTHKQTSKVRQVQHTDSITSRKLNFHSKTGANTNIGGPNNVVVGVFDLNGREEKKTKSLVRRLSGKKKRKEKKKRKILTRTEKGKSAVVSPTMISWTISS